MTVRTIQFYGKGYAPGGDTPITITATANGSVLYTGPITTEYTDNYDYSPSGQVVLFTVEVPMDLAGTIPMTIAIDNPADVNTFFEQIEANYTVVPNPIYTQAELDILKNPASTQQEKLAIWEPKAVPALSQAEIDILTVGTVDERVAVLAAHGLQVVASSGPDVYLPINGNIDPRSNVVINGEPKTRGATPPGAWGWGVVFPADASGTITCDITLRPGMA
jgi:hypothetical protein